MGLPMQKMPGIQIARAVAALSVCYFHSWTVLDRFPQNSGYPIPGLSKYGWLGVDLFFGISGFVICLVVTRPNFSVREFLIRRVFRIYPLWLVTLGLWAAMAWAWRGLLPSETLGSFIYAATLLPTHGFPFYDIGWSLQHEIAFYLIAALTVARFGVNGLIAVLCISIALNHIFSLPWYLSQLSSYHAEFLAGMIAFLLSPRLRWAGSIVPCLVGTMLLFGILFTGSATWLFPIPLFCLLVGFANVRQSRTTAWLAGTGDASYSIYLLHPLIFAIAKSMTKLSGTGHIWLEEPLRFTTIGIVIALALLSWRLFERPIINAGERLTTLNRPRDVDTADRRLSDGGGHAAATSTAD